jgi:hypothetical protein
MNGLTGVRIWIDDLRPAPKGYIWCKTYNQAISTLEYHIWCEGGIEEVCFDHDLGEDKSGYDIAKYMVENQIWTKGFSVHSMNPVGRQNIISLLTHYGYKQSAPSYIK